MKSVSVSLEDRAQGHMIEDKDGEVLIAPWRVLKVTLALLGQGFPDLSEGTQGLLDLASACRGNIKAKQAALS